MSNLPQCPQCDSSFTYEDRDMFVCPECAYEWPQSGEVNEDEKIIKDSNCNVLSDGDTITVIKDLKVKGSSAVVKVGSFHRRTLLSPVQPRMGGRNAPHLNTMGTRHT